jgi:serine/threonine protein kinase
VTCCSQRDRFAKYSESFQREAEVLARLNHPHIIRMFGLVVDPPAPRQAAGVAGGGSGGSGVSPAGSVGRGPSPANGGIGGGGGRLPRGVSPGQQREGSQPPPLPQSPQQAQQPTVAGIMMEYLRGGSLAQVRVLLGVWV